MLRERGTLAQSSPDRLKPAANKTDRLVCFGAQERRPSSKNCNEINEDCLLLLPEMLPDLYRRIGMLFAKPHCLLPLSGALFEISHRPFC